jgi:hypothetical protein
VSSREMSTGASAALAGDEIIPVVLGKFEFGSGTVYLWTGSDVGPIEWDGHTWTGCGALASIGGIEETEESRAVGIELELTGIPLTTLVDGIEIDILAIANDEDWQQRPARLYFGILNTDFTWRVEPFQIRKGLMDVMQLDEGKTATIKLYLESQQVDLERAEVLRYTAETQRALYAGDKGCDQVAALQDKEVVWNLS